MLAGTPVFERVRYNVLFETLPDSAFHTIKEKLVERHFAAGDVIFEDDAEGEELFMIAAGRVKIMKKSREGKEYLIALLHEGDFFGELELIDGRSRSARVIALEECVIFSLHQNHFDLLLHTNHFFAVRLLTALSVRLRSSNYHFMAETDRRARESRAELSKREHLIEATKRLNSTLNLDELLQIILDLALEMVSGDRGTVYLVDERKNELWAKVAKGLNNSDQVRIHLPQGKGIAGYVGATGDTINIPDAYLDPRFSPEFDKATGYVTRSILCMPMRRKDGKIIGVFQLLNKRKGAFTAEDEILIASLSVHAALAIENARLYEQERQKVILERDLTAAREVQMSLIPKELPHLPGYEFAASTIPARQVGGDLYDIHPVGDERFALCLGDVSGKGLPASLVMANLLAILRSQTFSQLPVHETITRSNRQLYRYTGAEKFVTLLFGVLDAADHSFTYTNAGQEQPYLLSGDKPVRRLDAGGIPVGMLEDVAYAEERISLAPGDLLAIVSDGVTEAMSPLDELFGEERLLSVLLAHKNDPASHVLTHVLAAVAQHSAHAPQSDDITIVIVKRLPG
jgi:sigma-B regulation protein RsbU (phosphoserine phosphatase)